MKNTPQVRAVNPRHLSSGFALVDRAIMQQEFHLPRDLSARLLELLPHVKMGRAGLGVKRCVQRRDLESFLERAARERLDLVQLVRDMTPEAFRTWFEDSTEAAA